MISYFTAKDADAFPPSPQQNGDILYRLTLKELTVYGSHLGIPDRIIQEYAKSGPSKLESHNGFDYFCLNIPDFSDLTAPMNRTIIYFAPHFLVFASDDNPLLDNILDEAPTETASVQKLLLTFFDRLTREDFSQLEDLEQEISDLEEALITSKKQSCIKEIVLLRKKLMKLRRYYEQLASLFDVMEENLNGLLDKRDLRFVHILSGRVDRLDANVCNLRDYVTQVREAYQAQVDINLNSLMKLFTVITAIFSPLSLVAGWYGMNFDMPEYHWMLGYPIVIGVSGIIIVSCIILFKKNKWL